jgi:urocanate hydratase
LAPDSKLTAALGLAMQVEAAYLSLMKAAHAAPGEEPSMGGKLLHAGELDEAGRALVVAANVAGAATLAATADAVAQKQAVRDGVVDFLVTSLDEALRILKNEIRKRETVAVCVGVASDAVESEMRERGVAPDVVRSGELFAASSTADQVLLHWSVDSAPAQWLPKLDAIALDCLESDARAARRWLRLAPRYLGRMAHGVRTLYADPEFAVRFIEQVRERVERGEIGTRVELHVSYRGGNEEHHFAPRVSSEKSR